jgi:ribosomal protein S27AE
MSPSAGLVVIERYLCPKCSGTRIILNPLWQRFWAETKAGTVVELQSFMAEHGAPTVPAEAMVCPKCHGTGYDDREVGLSEALSKLGVAHG